MPRSYKGHKYILCIINEVTNYLITVPIHQAKSEVGDTTLIENVITKYCIPEYIIMDQDSTFMSAIMTCLLNKFNIKIKTMAPYNNQSLQAEHGIKSLPNILTKHLTRSDVAKILIFGYICLQHINTTNLENRSSYELTFGRKPMSLLNFNSIPDIKVTGSFREYYDLLNKRLKYLHNLLLNCRSKRLAMINKDRAFSNITAEIWSI